ncbi:MAG: hypothetical protein LBT89_12740 [Planctomycetaceae bacterium]|jgi:hypothetical protein|nr:hypothetical protein [Planctomycetaceae bacterium]
MFAFCYALALVLEIIRCTFAARYSFGHKQRLIPVVLVFAGFVAQTLFLYLHHIAGENQLAAAQMYFQVSAWGLAFMYLYWSLMRPKISFGIILLPIILLLLAGSSFNYTSSSGSARLPHWVMLHTIAMFLATAAVIIGGVTGSFYLMQDYILHKKKRPPENIPLPTLEWSLAVCRETLKAAAVFFAAGLFIGCMLYYQNGRQTSLADPLVLGTAVLLVFLCTAGGCYVQTDTEKQNTAGRTIAVIALTAFVLLVLTILFGLSVGSAHWR